MYIYLPKYTSAARKVSLKPRRICSTSQHLRLTVRLDVLGRGDVPLFYRDVVHSTVDCNQQQQQQEKLQELPPSSDATGKADSALPLSIADRAASDQRPFSRRATGDWCCPICSRPRRTKQVRPHIRISTTAQRNAKAKATAAATGPAASPSTA